jgi:integrase
VFTHEDGRALSPNGVSQRLDRLVTRHDVPAIRLYDLRHVAATLALTAGVDVKVVSEQLGHTTTQITRDIYPQRDATGRAGRRGTGPEGHHPS